MINNNTQRYRTYSNIICQSCYWLLQLSHMKNFVMCNPCLILGREKLMAVFPMAFWLVVRVVEPYPPKNMKVNWDDEIADYMEHIFNEKPFVLLRKWLANRMQGNPKRRRAPCCSAWQKGNATSPLSPQTAQRETSNMEKGVPKKTKTECLNFEHVPHQATCKFGLQVALLPSFPANCPSTKLSNATS